MDTNLLERHFEKIGARIRVHRLRPWQQDDYQLDVGSDRAGEFFDFSVHPAVEFQLLQSRADQRHLLLLASDGKRFLCGHDERHWFVAGIADRVSTVPTSLTGDIKTPFGFGWRATAGFTLAGVVDIRIDAVGPIGGRERDALLRIVLARSFPVIGQ